MIETHLNSHLRYHRFYKEPTWFKIKKTYSNITYAEWYSLRIDMKFWCNHNVTGLWHFELENLSPAFHVVVYFENKIDAAKFELLF